MGVINISFRIMREGIIQSLSGTQGGFKCVGFVSLRQQVDVYNILFPFCV